MDGRALKHEVTVPDVVERRAAAWFPCTPYRERYVKCMRTLLRPVGSLPATVYWVRRILALVLLALLLWTLGALVLSGPDADPATTASQCQGHRPR